MDKKVKTADQVQRARETIQARPGWMKETVRFTGGDVRANSVASQKHKVRAATQLAQKSNKHK